MKSTYFLLAVFTLSTSICKVLSSAGDGSFFESDTDFRRIHRNLLQDTEYTDELNDGENGDESDGMTNVAEEGKEEEVTKETDLFTPGENKLGNYLICHNNKDKHFNLQVSEYLILNLILRTNNILYGGLFDGGG